MKIKIKKVSVLTISSFLMLSSVAFASPVSNKSAQENAINVMSLINKTTHEGNQKCCHKHGHNKVMLTTLKEKFKITETEFENAKTSGKSIFDLAKTKGFTEEQVKIVLLQQKYKHIDDAVSQGKMDKVKAESIKTKMKLKMAEWDGKIRDTHKNSSDAPKEKAAN